VPAPGEPHDDLLVPLCQHALALAGRPLDFFDAHTHLGQNDPDGRRATPEEIVAGLDRAGHHRALIFPMHEPGGYEAANGDALAAVEAFPGRLLALARVDPHQGDAAVAEAARRMDEGARGIKLHPRSDAFDLPHPVVERIVALADERQAVVLFHAGRGFPGLGEEAAHLARRHPGARLVLAHAGISDLGHLAEVAAEAPNLFFDTSWWQVSDLLTLYANVPPGRILYASDMPYGSPRFAMLAFLRCALTCGLGGEALAAIAGAQLERVVSRQEPLELGPAPGDSVLGGRDLTVERGLVYLGAAVQIGFRGGDPTEPLSLARLALRPARSDVAAVADALIARSLETLAHTDQPPAVPALAYPALVAQLLLGTAAVGVPG
jgi:predicted TIM-barrel fold metal-dependent hydrolase